MLKNNLNILNDSLLTTKCMKNHCFDKKETKKLQFFFVTMLFTIISTILKGRLFFSSKFLKNSVVWRILGVYLL